MLGEVDSRMAMLFHIFFLIYFSPFLVSQFEKLEACKVSLKISMTVYFGQVLSKFAKYQEFCKKLKVGIPKKGNQEIIFGFFRMSRISTIYLHSKTPIFYPSWLKKAKIGSIVGHFDIWGTVAWGVKIMQEELEGSWFKPHQVLGWAKPHQVLGWAWDPTSLRGSR